MDPCVRLLRVPLSVCPCVSSSPPRHPHPRSLRPVPLPLAPLGRRRGHAVLCGVGTSPIPCGCWCCRRRTRSQTHTPHERRQRPRSAPVLRSADVRMWAWHVRRWRPRGPGEGIPVRIPMSLCREGSAHATLRATGRMERRRPGAPSLTQRSPATIHDGGGAVWGG